MPSTIPEILREVTLFSLLNPVDLGQVAQLVAERTVPDGKVIFTEGDFGTSMFVIASGSVRIVKDVMRDEQRELATLGRGTVFGEMALIEGHTRSASAVASGEVRLLEINRQSIEELARQNPAAGFRIMQEIARVLSARLRRMNEEFIRVFSQPYRSIKELEKGLQRVRERLVLIGWEGTHPPTPGGS